MVAKKRWLDRDAVVRAAAAMANESGDARRVTLAALARRLDVQTPSLYNHVAGLEDLYYALALFALQELVREVQSASMGLIGREALAAAADAYRRFAHAHPGIYYLVIRAPEPGETELVNLAQSLLQTLLLMLASLGLDGDDALHAVRGLRAILHGFVSLEVAEGFKLGLDRDASFHRLVDAYLDGIAISAGQN